MKAKELLYDTMEELKKEEQMQNGGCPMVTFYQKNCSPPIPVRPIRRNVGGGQVCTWR